MPILVTRRTQAQNNQFLVSVIPKYSPVLVQCGLLSRKLTSVPWAKCIGKQTAVGDGLQIQQQNRPIKKNLAYEIWNMNRLLKHFFGQNAIQSLHHSTTAHFYFCSDQSDEVPHKKAGTANYRLQYSIIEGVPSWPCTL